MIDPSSSSSQMDRAISQATSLLICVGKRLVSCLSDVVNQSESM